MNKKVATTSTAKSGHHEDETQEGAEIEVVRQSWGATEGITIAKQYELAMGYVNQLSQRRQAVTTIHLSVNAALIAAITFLFKEGHPAGKNQTLTIVFLLISGFVSCNLWQKLIHQYSAIIDWWYKLLREMEATLPAKQQMFTREFAELYTGGTDAKRIGLTRYEKRLPYIYMIVYLCIIVYMLFALRNEYPKLL